MLQTSILRINRVKERTGLSRSAIYRDIAAGTFPKSIPLGPRSVGWTSDSIDKWIADRINASDTNDKEAAA